MMTQAELEKKLEKLIKPIVMEALELLTFEVVDAVAAAIIDRGQEDEWDD